MYSEETYRARSQPRALVCPSCFPNAMPLIGETPDQACARARAEMGALDPRWYQATCEQIQIHICSDDCTIYPPGSGDGLRASICGADLCPKGPPWPGFTNPPPPPPPGGSGSNLGLIVAGLAVVGILGYGLLGNNRGY